PLPADIAGAGLVALESPGHDGVPVSGLSGDLQDVGEGLYSSLAGRSGKLGLPLRVGDHGLPLLLSGAAVPASVPGAAGDLSVAGGAGRRAAIGNNAGDRGRGSHLG